MKYIYQVQYYNNFTLNDYNEYENEFFSSLSKAKKFMYEIIEDENWSTLDSNYTNWKIKISKHLINNKSNLVEWFYDLKGNLLFCSNEQKNIINIFQVSKDMIGKIISIEAFPWCKTSKIQVSLQGVIGDIYDNTYVIYIIDNFKVTHFHLDNDSFTIVDNISTIDQKIFELKNIILKKDKTKNMIKLLDGQIYWFEK